MEGTILLAPVSYAAPPPAAPTTDLEAAPKVIGARLGPSARLIEESIADLRALTRQGPR